MSDPTDQTAVGGLPAQGRPRVGWWGGVAALAAVAAAFAVGRIGGPAGRDEGEGAADPPATARFAGLPADAQVVGVTLGTRHRAYLVSALTEVRHHVVNDRLGDAAVSVAYCDKTDCARGYTAPGRAEPLDLAVGGWSGADGMLVRVGRYRYTQQAGRAVDAGAPPFPYLPVEVKRTTWGEWLAAHPDTELAGW